MSIPKVVGLGTGGGAIDAYAALDSIRLRGVKIDTQLLI